MFLTVIAMTAALAAGQQSQSMGAVEALRPPPPPPPAPAPAGTPNTAAPEAEAGPEAAPRQVCRSIQVTGTRFPVRQCRNARETEAERAEAREMLRRMQGSRTMPVG